MKKTFKFTILLGMMLLLILGLDIRKANANSDNMASYTNAFYNKSFDELVSIQMSKNPMFYDSGRWRTASRVEVEKYLNPSNFLQFQLSEYIENVKIGKVTTSVLNVREGSGTNFKIIDTVKYGETYKIEDKVNNWYKIKTARVTGWVSGDYLEISSTNESSVEYINSIKVTASELNVRTGPNVSYNKVGTVNRNETFVVLESNSGWYKINTNGTLGWISGDHTNFTTSAPQEMFQFMKLSGSSGISLEELNIELKGKGILDGMGQAFLEAGKEYDVNEIYLLSHAILETGNGRSTLANGVMVTEVGGQAVEPRLAYNMFGIGAYDSSPLKGGSEYAYKQGWFSPEDAIKGGAQWIVNNYINHPTYKQNTLYKMKWNPDYPGVHQYATDVAWAYKQTRSMNLIGEICDRISSVNLKFEIPIYKDINPSIHWKEEDGKWILIDSDGSLVVGWKKLEDNWYYMSDEGIMQVGWQLIDGDWYYMNSSGIMQTGWQDINGKSYYMNTKGIMLKDTIIDGYSLGTDGSVLGQWEKIENDWYYIIKDRRLTGWNKIDGQWYYMSSNGVMETGWQKINDSWYYMASSGRMETGWQKINDSWYYLSSSGSMVTGWIQINGNKYYMASSGSMQTGWKKINDSWYYLSSSGSMITGWKLINGNWYYMSSNGVMQIGWQKISSSWYYLASNGSMVTGWRQINGNWYHMASNGRMQTGWQKIGGIWYYMYDNGSMAKDTIIDGYELNSSGAWIR